MIQAPLPELGHGTVELGGDPADLALGHPGVDAQGGHEVADSPGGDRDAKAGPPRTSLSEPRHGREDAGGTSDAGSTLKCHHSTGPALGRPHKVVPSSIPPIAW